MALRPARSAEQGLSARVSRRIRGHGPRPGHRHEVEHKRQGENNRDKDEEGSADVGGRLALSVGRVPAARASMCLAGDRVTAFGAIDKRQCETLPRVWSPPNENGVQLRRQRGVEARYHGTAARPRAKTPEVRPREKAEPTRKACQDETTAFDSCNAWLGGASGSEAHREAVGSRNASDRSRKGATIETGRRVGDKTKRVAK
jgi:hypothetical protein